MQIDRLLYPVTSLGPGKRLCIWTIGCKKKCLMCANPELRKFDKKKDLSMENIEKMLSLIDFSMIDGVTISGGEPFCQSEDLLKLLKIISQKSEDILVFSGYTYEELKKTDNPLIIDCLRHIGVLIAGEYINELNDNKTSLIASTNQEMIFIKPNLQSRYAEYQKKGRQIQNVFHNNEMMSVGIHNKEGNGER